MYGGTRRYYKSEQIRVIIHTGSDQTYADTYQIRTLVHNRYRSQQIRIPGLYRFRTYPKKNRVVHNRLLLIRISHRSYRAYSHAKVILITDFCLFGTPVGGTELILIHNSGYFHITKGIPRPVIINE